MADIRQRGTPAVRLVVPTSTVNAIAQTVTDTAVALGDPLPQSSKGPGGAIRLASYGEAFLKAPYHIDPFMWMSYLINLFLEFVLSFAMCVTVTNMASYATSTSIGLNAICVAPTYAVVLIFGQSWRAAYNLPRHLFPALTVAENLHTHVGLVVGIPYLAVQLAGSAVAAPVLNALGSNNLPNYATAPRPISFWGAVCLQTIICAFVVYAFLQNTTFKHHHLLQPPKGPNARKEARGPNRAFKATSLFMGFAIFMGVIMTYGNGLYSCGNPIITFASYINTGGWSTPDSGAFTLDLVWPLVAGAAGWAMHLVTWNVNALSAMQVQEAVAAAEAEEE